MGIYQFRLSILIFMMVYKIWDRRVYIVELTTTGRWTNTTRLR